MNAKKLLEPQQFFYINLLIMRWKNLNFTRISFLVILQVLLSFK